MSPLFWDLAVRHWVIADRLLRRPGGPMFKDCPGTCPPLNERSLGWFETFGINYTVTWHFRSAMNEGFTGWQPHSPPHPTPATAPTHPRPNHRHPPSPHPAAAPPPPRHPTPPPVADRNLKIVWHTQRFALHPVCSTNNIHSSTPGPLFAFYLNSSPSTPISTQNSTSRTLPFSHP